ncbi:hypothetical protein ABT285_29745 [Streptomyces microflavus]|uniref:hypothetical protein n=1 Tax=Streptomyces microflavus TaxID=1919 RepID=UPI00331C24CE
MDDVLLNAAPGAAGAMVLLFLGAWENDRRTRRTERRRQAAVDRDALEAQADEVVAAVLAVQIAGNAHDHLYGGWKARLGLIGRALMGAGAAFAESRQRGLMATMAFSHALYTESDRWDRESSASAAALAAPLARLGQAVAPLMRRQEPGLAAAVDEVFTAVAEDFGNEDRIMRALAAFNEALRPALAPPAPPRRWWSLRRGSS